MQIENIFDKVIKNAIKIKMKSFKNSLYRILKKSIYVFNVIDIHDENKNRCSSQPNLMRTCIKNNVKRISLKTRYSNV